MQNGHDKHSDGRKRIEQPTLRKLLARSAEAVGAVGTAAALVTGCSSSPPSLSPAAVVTADCNTLSSNLGQAVVDLGQTQGGAIPSSTSAATVVRAAQIVASNDFSAGIVEAGAGPVTEPMAPQFERNAAIDAFDGMVGCAELTEGLAPDAPDPAIASAAAQQAFDNTVTAGVLVAGLNYDAGRFPDLRPADQSAIGKANSSLRAALSAAKKLRQDLPRAGIQPPKGPTTTI